MSAGIWAYTHERSIADHYDTFVADTPLCDADEDLLNEMFPMLVTAVQTGFGDLDHSAPVIADLGCGTGRSAIPLAARGYRVVAIDLSQPMLARLVFNAAQFTGRATSRERAAGRIDPLRANLVELDCLADNSVDHAVCLFSTLGMVQGRGHRRQLLRHAARIVRPGGWLVVHVHARLSALREPGGGSRLLGSWLQSWIQPSHEFGDSTYRYRGIEKMFLHRFSRRELSRDLRTSGWQIEHWETLAMDGTRQRTGWLPRILACGGHLVVGRSGPEAVRRVTY